MLRAQIEAERANIASYTGQLDTLDNGENGAHDLVGHVARAKLRLVRDKLRGHRSPRRRRHHRAGVGGARGGARRVHNLQTERAREEQLLDEEQREVLDDSNTNERGALTMRRAAEPRGSTAGAYEDS